MALPLTSPSCSLISPRTQIAMLESSFEDIFLDEKLIEYGQELLDLPMAGLKGDLLPEKSSSLKSLEMDTALMTPDEWSLISRDALAISSHFKALADEVTDDSWYDDDFDLLTSHRPWEVDLLDLPDLDSSSTEHGQNNLIDFSDSKLSCDTAMLSFDLLHNATAINATMLLDLDDSLTGTQLLKTTQQQNTSYTVTKNNASFTIANAKDSPLNFDYHSLAAAELLKTPPLRKASYTIDKVISPFLTRTNESYTIAKVDSPFVTPEGNASYTVAKGNESYTIGKANASYTISTPSTEISPIPGSASKNSSFSEVAEKFHSLRRSMSSDSVMPLSQDKISGLSLTTRALVPTQPLPLPPPNAAFCAAVADMRLRPSRAPLAAKGPMRAMLPLGQMTRATAEEANVVEPAAKKQCQRAPPSPLPAAKSGPAMRPAAMSTPLRGTPPRATPSRRSISTSPVRRSTPVRSASSGYGQRSPANVPRKPQDEPRIVDKKPTGAVPRTSLLTAAASKKGGARPSGLPKPISKGIPRPVLAVANANVRLGQIKAPLRVNHAVLPTLKGKENQC